MADQKRIIKFRGKPIDDRKYGIDFVYGSLVQAADGTFIIEEGTSMQFEEPEYHKRGMGCGLEDQEITDRYEAMAHGWQKAIDKCAELYPSVIEVNPETVGQFTGLMDHSDPREEIYEGDFVLVTEDGNISCHKVVYGIEYDYPAFDLSPSLDVECNELQHCIVSSGMTIEIIGNTTDEDDVKLLDKDDKKQ